jgi:hypothetical protein
MGPMIKQPMRAALVLGIATFLSAGSVLASAIVQSVKGEARASLDVTRHGPVVPGQRYQAGTTFKTGPGGQMVLKFDDGQNVVLNENTEFKVAEYRYAEAKPAEDRSVFELLTGALRVISGAIGKRNQAAFELRIPQATIGIRGTDFMVVLVNPAYVSVTQGAVAATNAAGTAAFGAGTVGSVTSFNVLGAAIPASSLPAAASSAFSTMSSASLAATGAAPGSGGSSSTSHSTTTHH